MLSVRSRIGLVTRAFSMRSAAACKFRLPEEAKKEFNNPAAKYTTAQDIPEKGTIYDKKPFMIEVKKGKTYMWCACGRSRKQPLCDGSHRNPFLRIKQRPVKFVADEDKEVWFCMCKQTDHRPFCDGSHQHPDVQAAVRGH
ncbi:CDGSH iron-sulfur domain-containing protein 3, mitochondrial-like [Pollicipes pollicipes]|uniref:CDGSH iron-sulfur domain-containing protein 3, mitochondrial-like n=1 Tax=Pollicipes pollicipes TaxID=41117 RepID=UPI0018858A81|nr:CDGSH iron-sulfur domain-containing protein 3, mitochondrial-like [Pollicipes pollicipes]